jgi:hypothetical protein
MLLDVRSSWFIKDGYVLYPQSVVPKKRGTQTKHTKAETHRELQRRIAERRR